MKSTTIFAVLCLLLLPAVLQAQVGGAMFNVFPQVADGYFQDGSYYESVLVVTNTYTSGVSCNVLLWGVPNARLDGPNTFTLSKSGAINILLTTGRENPIATGYATLFCTGNVNAILLYQYVAQSGERLGAATVFPSSSSVLANLPVVTEGGGQVAMAIANDNSVAMQVLVSVLSPTGSTVGARSIDIPAKSNVAKFLADLVTLPQGFEGEMRIQSTSSSRFQAIGFYYFGTTFTTTPFTTLQ